MKMDVTILVILLMVVVAMATTIIVTSKTREPGWCANGAHPTDWVCAPYQFIGK